MRIAHTADWHIRLQKRHEEYREVINNFRNSIEENKIDRVLIAGDLFHSKTVLNPESYLLAKNLLTSIATYCPVDIIVGNHDCIVNQSKRLDAIYPLVQNIESECAVTLFRDSGIYSISDKVSYGVFSIVDKKFPIEFDRENEKCYIAIYHGAINNSATETGYAIRSENNIDMFKNYDIFMLGDIHKFQELRWNKGNATGAYSGSIIQQNFGEELNKGYIIWDIEDVNNFSSSFCKLNNRYGYHTIHLPKADVNEIDKLDIKVSEKPYVRVILQTSSYNVLTAKNISSYIREKFNPVSISIETVVDASSTSLCIGDSEIENVANKLVQRKLIEDFAKKLDSSEEDIAGILKIHEERYADVTDEYYGKRCSSWNIDYIRFSNTFSYADNNYIDFNSIPGLVGIFAKNRSGKSSILSTLLVGIFKHCDRINKRNLVDIINKREDEASIEIGLTIGSDKYRIDRVITRREKDKDRASNDIALYKIEGDEEINITGDANKNEAENHIRSILGDYDNHKIASFGLQNNLTNFIHMNQGERKVVLSSFIGIDVIENLYNVVNNECTAIKTVINQYKKHDYRSALKSLEIEREELKDKLLDITADKEVVSNKLDSIRKIIDDLKSAIKKEDEWLEIIKDMPHISSIEDLDSARSAVENQLKINKDKFDNISLNINKLSQRSLEITLEELQKLEYVDIENNYKHVLNVREKLVDLLRKKQIVEEKIRSSKKLVIILDKHDWFEQSEFCKKCEFLKSAFKAKEDIVDIQDCLSNIIEYENKLKSELEYFDIIERKYREFEALKAENSNIEHNINSLNVELEKTRRLVDIAEREYEKLNKYIESFKENEAAITFNIKLNKEIEEITETENKLKIELSEFNDEFIDVRTKIAAIEQKIADLSESLTSVKEIEVKFRQYSLLKNILSKNGIQLSIVKKVVPIINSEISKILSDIPNFEIILEIDEDSKYLDIYIEDDTGKRRIELGSGMEETIAAISIRAALANISLLPKSNLFILDEGFGTLDSENLSIVNDILVKLKEMFKTILIISHIEEMADSCDHIITIDRDSDGYSQIKVGE